MEENKAINIVKSTDETKNGGVFQIKPQSIIEKQPQEKTTTPAPNNDRQNQLNSIEKRNVADIFGVSETELEDEFNAFKVEKLLRRVDYLLDGGLSTRELRDRLAAARRHGFGSVTVFPLRIKEAELLLQSSRTRVNTLVAYPYGEEEFSVVLSAVKKIKKTTADKVCVVLPQSQHEHDKVKTAQKNLKKLVKSAGKVKLAVIVNLDGLTQTEIMTTVKICLESGVERIAALVSVEPQRCVLQIKNLSALCSDKIKLEVMGSFDAKNAVRFFKAGASIVASREAVKIAEELHEQIKR